MKIQAGSVVALVLFAVCGCATMNEPKPPDVAIEINGYEDGSYSVSMKNPFRYFDKACCYYRKGKLYRINVWTDIGKEYSQASTDTQIKKDLSDFAEKTGLARTYFAYNN